MEKLVPQLPKEYCSGKQPDMSGRPNKQSRAPHALGMEQGQSYVPCFPSRDHTAKHIAGSQ